MPSASTDKSSSKSASKSKTGQMDAITLLKEDHREVEGMFEKFEQTNGPKTKAQLAEKICMALKVHTQIEEEIFYPEARSHDVESDIIDEAVVEHAEAKKLIAEIEQMQVDDDLFDAKVKVLGEMIQHHVEEEEKDFFPQAKKSGMDLETLGEQMAGRKAELMKQLKAQAENKLQ